MRVYGVCVAEFPRSLSGREAAVLHRLIQVQPEPLRSVYETQARSARVGSVCGCGCPTINLIVNAAQAKRAGDDERWEIAHAESPLGPVILVVSEGWLESLELLYWSGDPAPTEFPDPSEMTPHLRSEP